MKGIPFLWMMGGLIFPLLHLSETTVLQSCPDSYPPCTLAQSTHQQVCRGENVTATVDLQLPHKVIQQIDILTDIMIYRGEQPFIIGLDNNPGFPQLWHWRASYTVNKKDGMSGLLTVKIDVEDVEPEDEFETRIEIQLTDQVLMTSDETWFTVNDNCRSRGTETSGDFIEQLGQNIESINNYIMTDSAGESHNASDYLSPEQNDKNIITVMWITLFIAGGIIFLVFAVLVQFSAACIPHFKRLLGKVETNSRASVSTNSKSFVNNSYEAQTSNSEAIKWITQQGSLSSSLEMYRPDQLQIRESRPPSRCSSTSIPF